MSHFEQRLRGEEKFRGKIIDVIHDTVLLENGREALREVARHPGAVGILVVEGEELVLVRQFRYPIGKELLEIPAGKLERGEEPYPAALRELREETGGLTEKLEYLGDYYGSAGFCDEKLTLYFAHVEKTGENDPDEDEFLTVERYPLPVFEAMIARGEIVDGKTLSAYTLAKAKGLL
ncbi:MAG: NUDIX hydrolase [Clostridia bacterium]|nr:NUDIX hydrolase [Clostridia bacterium]